MKKILLTFSIILLLFPATFGIVFADWRDWGLPEGTVGDTYEVLAPLPGTCEKQADGKCLADVSGGNLGEYFNALYRIVVAGASVLVVLQIVVGAFSYISTDAIDKKEDGKHKIKTALGGMMLILVSWVILNTINPQLVQLNIVSTQLKPYNLMDFVVMNQRAQEQYKEVLMKIEQKVNANFDTTKNTLEAANGMMKTLEDYKNTKRLMDLKNKEGNLSEEEITEMQTLLGTYGDITQKQLDDLENIINQSGGEDGLAKKANELRELSEITGIAATAITQAQSHANQAENGRNLNLRPVDYVNYAQANGYEYKKTIKKIDDGLEAGLISQSHAEELKKQAKDAISDSINRICNALSIRYPTTSSGGGGMGGAGDWGDRQLYQKSHDECANEKIQ